MFFFSFLSSIITAATEAFFFVIIALALSYLVLPVTKLFNRFFSWVLPRTLSWNLATVISFLCIIGLIGFGVFTLFTVSVAQAQDLIKVATDHSFLENGINFINSSISYLVSELNNFKHFKIEKVFGPIDPSLFQIANPKEISSMVVSFAHNSMNSFTKTGQSFLKAIFMLSLYMSAAFHIIREWNFWGDRFDYFSSWLTRTNSKRFFFFLDSFSKGMKSWIIGQVVISLIMGTYYSVCFAAIGIIGPVPIGLMFGFSSFAPYIGDLISIASLTISCIYSTASLVKVLLIIASIVIGHIVGGHILGPILIGSHTGINPVQSIVGFIVYSQVFGFRGIFLGLPISLFINALVSSYFYKEKCDFEKMQIMPDDH